MTKVPTGTPREPPANPHKPPAAILRPPLMTSLLSRATYPYESSLSAACETETNHLATTRFTRGRPTILCPSSTIKSLTRAPIACAKLKSNLPTLPWVEWPPICLLLYETKVPNPQPQIRFPSLSSHLLHQINFQHPLLLYFSQRPCLLWRIRCAKLDPAAHCIDTFDLHVQLVNYPVVFKSMAIMQTLVFEIPLLFLSRAHTGQWLGW